jgi:chromosome segregation ATPase
MKPTDVCTCGPPITRDGWRALDPKCPIHGGVPRVSPQAPTDQRIAEIRRDLDKGWTNLGYTRDLLDAVTILQQRVEQLEEEQMLTVRIVERHSALRQSAEQRLEAAERERDAYRALAKIGIWHDDCRPNRHMAARELAKSQAIIDKLADTVSALTREKEAAEHRELQLRSAIAGIGEHQAELDHLTIVELAMSQRDRLEAAEATIASLRETARLAMDALAHHDDWCGYNRKAEGHPSWNKAWAALDVALAALPSSPSRTAEE